MSEGNGTDSAPDDVGESITRRAEDVAKKKKEPGRQDEGTKGASDRPTGSSTGRDVTSIDPDDGDGQPAGGGES